MTACPAFPLRAAGPGQSPWQQIPAPLQCLSVGAQSRDTSFWEVSQPFGSVLCLQGCTPGPKGLLSASGRKSSTRPLPHRQPPTHLDFSKSFGVVSFLRASFINSCTPCCKAETRIHITAGNIQDLQDPWTFLGSFHYFCMTKTPSSLSLTLGWSSPKGQQPSLPPGHFFLSGHV